MGGGPGGVRDRGAYGRDDPVNWEILIIPHQYSGCMGAGDQSPTGTRQLACVLSGQELSASNGVGQQQGEPELNSCRLESVIFQLKKS